ncbi:MAG: endo-1,4-beta-xylanase [Planctomycetales bacterium]
MGVMRFLIEPESLLTDSPELFRAYFSHAELGVFPTRVERSGNVLVCSKDSPESARLHVSWEVPGFGRPLLMTSSLLEQQEPYVLALELARGKVVHVRNQLSVWESAGLKTSEKFQVAYQRAHRHLGKACALQKDLPACIRDSQAALEAICEAAELLAEEQSERDLQTRCEKYGHLQRLMGVQIGEAFEQFADERLVKTFNTIAVPIGWRQIEPVEGEYRWEALDRQLDWCLQSKLIPRGGPLLDFGSQRLPEWLWKWERDPWNLQSFVCDFVETALRRYLGRIRMWEVCSHANSGGALTLTEEQRLGITAKAFEIARHVDEEAQLFLRIDQPWGEYMARGMHRLSPLQFADALHRSGLGLGGINLEIAIGYQPSGTFSRDPLDFSRMIDEWSRLGLPLHITLAFPTSEEQDDLAAPDLEVTRPSWKQGWSEQAQADWIDLFVPVLLSKSAVMGIFWSHLSDGTPHLYPHAGLLNAAHQPKQSYLRLLEQGERCLG